MPLLKRKPDHENQYSTEPETLPDTSEDIFDLDDLDLSGDGEETGEDFEKALDSLDCFEPAEGWSKKVTDDLPKPLSKKVTRRRRRSNDRDAQTIKAIQESELSAAPAHYPSLVGILQPLISTPSTPQTPPTPNNENVRAPAWVFTTERAKLFAANRAIAGAAHAFTLNLGPDQLQRALASPKGFSAYMRLAIMRALKRELGYVPHFWFAVDVTGQDRLHLHGGIACDDNAFEPTARALRQAGGNWASLKHHDRQLELVPQTNLDGWVNYALGNLAKARRLISGKGVVISNPLRKRAQALYEAMRWNSQR